VNVIHVYPPTGTAFAGQPVNISYLMIPQEKRTFIVGDTLTISDNNKLYNFGQNSTKIMGRYNRFIDSGYRNTSRIESTFFIFKGGLK
jgi:hypothetical protein